MMELKQKVKALIVDDDSDYVLGLTDVAALEGIELTHETYWDSAFKMISADPFRFEVIILDRRGQINASSDSADAEHLSKAIEELSRLQGQGYEIPWLINTGFKLDDIRRHAGKAFRKFSDQGEMLERVKTLAIENPENRMKVRFPEVYSLLISIDASDKTSYHQFLDLFKMIELRASKLTDPRNQIRQLLEAFCKLANKSGIIDRRITHQNGRVNLTACSRWINGKEVHLPNHKSPKWKLGQNPNRFLLPYPIMLRFSGQKWTRRLSRL